MEKDKGKKSNIVSHSPPVLSDSFSSFRLNSSLDFLDQGNQFAFLKRYADVGSPVYELHDFKGKLCKRQYSNRPNRFKLSLSSIDEIVYKDVETTVFKSNQNRHLCRAVVTNKLDFVSTLLNRGVSPNFFDEHRRTPLHLAVSKGYCEMVLLLLNGGANPNSTDGLGNSCLHLAACTNNVEMASILIKGGASVNAVDIRGRSPVQLAQSKLRILQKSQNECIKSKVTQIIDMLLLYLEKGPKNCVKADESVFLSNFQSRLQVTDTPEEISYEIDTLRKMLNEMETLSIS